MESKQHMHSSDEEPQRIAVPYVPPPPPDSSSLKRFRSPVINGVVAAFIILLAGFMLYNFLGHQLTQLAGESSVKAVSPSPTITSTATPAPSPSSSSGY